MDTDPCPYEGQSIARYKINPPDDNNECTQKRPSFAHTHNDPIATSTIPAVAIKNHHDKRNTESGNSKILASPKTLINLAPPPAPAKYYQGSEQIISAPRRYENWSSFSPYFLLNQWPAGVNCRVFWIFRAKTRKLVSERNLITPNFPDIAFRNIINHVTILTSKNKSKSPNNRYNKSCYLTDSW